MSSAHATPLGGKASRRCSRIVALSCSNATRADPLRADDLRPGELPPPGRRRPFAAHAPLAHQAGLGPEVIEALRTGTTPVFSNESAEVVYELVTEYLSTHVIADATYARARAAIAEESLVDVVAIAGIYAVVCMTLNVFRMPLPEGVANPFPHV